MAKNILDDFRRNASNFLYIFISDEAARRVFNTPQGRIIYQKRAAQIRYVINAAQSTRYTYNQFREAIAQQIITDYGKTPGQLLTEINNGRNVYSLNKISTPKGAKKISNSRITGIGATQEAGDVNGQHFISTPTTGVVVPQGSKGIQVVPIYNTETRTLVGNYDANTGTQLNYLDPATGTYRIGAQTTGQETRNLWANNINWGNIITMIIEFIGRLLGITQSKNLAAYQSDGWYTTVNTTPTTTGNIATFATLGILGYMLVTTDEATNNKKNKNKK